MNKYFWRIFLVGGLLGAGLACGARRPVINPEARLEAGRPVAVQQDIDDCLARARAAGPASRPEGRVAGSTAVGAATGAAVGAAVGAVAGGAGRGAAMGAAGGGAGGLIRGLFQSRDLDPEQRRRVEECLKDKGYQVTGWE